MALLKKPLGREAAARPMMPQPGQSAGESGTVADQSARRPSPLTTRTAELLQRLRAQQHGAAERQLMGSATERGALPVSADADLNRIQLTGCLGSEPLLYDVGDHPVATLALACRDVRRPWMAASSWRRPGST
jgi:hypothetical protein